jgi:hypothetical protein
MDPANDKANAQVASRRSLSVRAAAAAAAAAGGRAPVRTVENISRDVHTRRIRR